MEEEEEKRIINFFGNIYLPVLIEYSLGADLLNPEDFIKIFALYDTGFLSKSSAIQLIILKIYNPEKSVEELVKENHLHTSYDKEAIKLKILKIISNYPKEIERYHNGEDKLLGFFMGEIIKEINDSTINKREIQLKLKKLL